MIGKAPSVSLSRLIRASVVKKGLHAAFFNRLKRAGPKIDRLVIISPWIGTYQGKSHSIAHLTALVRRRRLRTYVFTRPPDSHDHLSALEMLADCPTIELVYNAKLHAKIYACVAPAPGGFAILGSANMTAHSTSLHEIGLIVQGAGGGEAIVKELAGFGLDYLRTRPESKVIKKMARRTTNGV